MSTNGIARPLAILGGPPAFRSSNPVPQILPSGYGNLGEHGAVDAILGNEPSPGSKLLANRQRYIAKSLSGSTPNHRSKLQNRLAEVLGVDTATTSVICLSKGTHTIRGALKALLPGNGPKTRDEVILPATTVPSTAEAVIMEGFKPVIVDVDPHSWMLSPEAAEKYISDKTAAIITVDWLGTHCDLYPFRQLANKYGIKLISDSAQSFGAGHSKPFDLADATIYSTGFPKVFHTGAGGILIIPKSLTHYLENDPTGFLRHEMMFETHAYIGLRGLDRLQETLEARAKMGHMYRRLLRDVPGIRFQHISPKSGATHYQLSVIIEAKEFGLDAKTLCEALRAENILCSVERMQCLGHVTRLYPVSKIGDLPVSRWLNANSVTLPIFEGFSPELCETICTIIKNIHEQSDDVMSRKTGIVFAPQASEQAVVIDIASKYRDCLIVPILDEDTFAGGKHGRVPSTILVPQRYLAENKISIDELHRRFLLKRQWDLGDEVVGELVVDALNGGIVFLAPRGLGYSESADKSVLLEESGSSAHVALVLKRDGQAVVNKSCSGYGIDGNGTPWLRRQKRFLEASIAVKETNLFVKPLWFKEDGDTISISLPYLPSHSLAEMAFAGIGSPALLTILGRLLGDMAADVWPKGLANAPANFIEQAHFDRMRRRVTIARAQVPELDRIANFESITLNGRKLLGFEVVLKALSCHPIVTAIGPRKLSEIHGDLNIHNILCQLDPHAKQPVRLIDPRGVPLLDENDTTKAFELGDYVYDLSKLKFSLSGFAEIRKGLYTLQREDEDGSYELLIGIHPGSTTMVGADRDFITMLSSDARMKQWVEAVEPSGAQSLELRVLLGEAAHFVADSACALGRDKTEEVLPLFLMGLEKLNNVLERLQKEGGGYVERLMLDADAVAGGPNYGAKMIQSALLTMGSPNASWAWDVLEVLVKSESAVAARKLLSDVVGKYLPKGTGVYVSTDPAAAVNFPCVLIHPSDGVRGQTFAVASSVRRTSAFLRDNGVSRQKIDELRTVTISSTGASTHSQFTARDNDRLLSPGTWGVSPLELILLQLNQLSFHRPGRWIVNNDSFFVLSQSLCAGGDGICLLTSERPTTALSSVCFPSTEKINGHALTNGFRNKGSDESDERLTGVTSAIFIPNSLAQTLVHNEKDYAARISPVLVDLVLPHVMKRSAWIHLCHAQGFGFNSDLAWDHAQRIIDKYPKVELVDGGDEMKLFHFGSDSEYTKLVDGAASDPLLNSLAYLPSAAAWVHSRLSSVSQ